jgi:hypothetical protein
MVDIQVHNNKFLDKVKEATLHHAMKTNGVMELKLHHS